MANEPDDTPMDGQGGQAGGGEDRQSRRLFVGIRPENWLSVDSSQPHTKVVTLADNERPGFKLNINIKIVEKYFN